MVSKVASKPPLSIEIEEDSRNNRSKEKQSLIYKPEIKGSAPI